MAKFIKFTYATNKTYYLPVDSTSAVGQAAADSTAVTIATGGKLVTLACAADSAFSMQIALSKAIYDVLSDSQLLKVDWTPSKAISAVTIA